MPSPQLTPAELSLAQQLRFSLALNAVAECIASTDDAETIFQRMTQAVGEALRTDRTLIYDISFTAQQARALSEHLLPGDPPVTPTRATYPLALFLSGATEVRRGRAALESHADRVSPFLAEDGSGAVLHGAMGIQSLLWVPFNFTEDGYQLLVLNQVREPREWTAAEHTFLESVGRQVTLALGKLAMVAARQKAEAEQAHLKDQLQHAMKMEALGRLAGGVAHDFNNLLTVITGNVSLAQHELSAADPLYPLLDEVREAADSAAGLTRQLLAFSRKQHLEPRVVRLTSLIERLDKMLRRLIGEDVDLRVEFASCGCWVRLDPGQFEQILVNLAVNARDAMPHGGQLHVTTDCHVLDEDSARAWPGLQPGRYVRLTVRDTGEGMDEAVRQRIFEPFFTTKKDRGGTGLGLATAYGAVRQAGGAIDVESRKGEGTTFRILLPAVEAPAAEAGPSPEQAPPQGRPRTVLLVEDEAAVLALATRILERAGYTVLPARDAQTAQAQSRRHEAIDVLVTDVVMPGLNGRQLAESLEAARPGLPVLYTSGYTDDVLLTHGVADGQQHFLAKPYTPEALLEKVAAALAGVRATSPRPTPTPPRPGSP